MKSQDKGLILKDRPSYHLKKGFIYLYCVTGQTPQLKEIWDLTKSIYFIYHSGLYAIVSEVSYDEFSEENLKKNLANLEWIKQRASFHEKIIEGIMKYTCVVPFKFATLFNSEGSLKLMLKKHTEIFKKNLNNLMDKEEWGIKIYCNMGRLKEILSHEDKEILKIDKEVDASSPGKAFILKKKKEDLIKDILNKRIREYTKACFERLKRQVLESKINKLLPKEVTERKEDMVLNSVFLVNKHRVNTLISIVEAFKTQYKDKGLLFEYTGPWPPYNFCK